MTTDPKTTQHKPLYYILLALGCAGLLGWFYLLRHWQLMEWMAQLGPETHKGSMNLVAIMLWLVPALVIWKYYLRWLNKHFDIRGQFDQDRHDAQYQTAAQDQTTAQGQATAPDQTTAKGQTTDSTTGAAKLNEKQIPAEEDKKN